MQRQVQEFKTVPVCSYVKMLPIGAHVRGIAIGDLNGDGRLDIMTANEGPTLSLFVNQGGRAFAAKVDLVPSGVAIWGALADLDGDKKLDIAAAVSSANAVATLFNRCH